MSRNPVCRRGTSPRFLPAAALGIVLLLGTAACSGTDTSSSGDGGVPASSNQPVAGGGLQLGSRTQAGVTVTDTGLRRNGADIAVLATVTSDHADRLVGITTNYTAPLTLPQPLTLVPGAFVRIDPTTAVLRPSGPIDDGATVAVSFTFATAGVVQVYGTYRT